MSVDEITNAIERCAKVVDLWRDREVASEILSDFAEALGCEIKLMVKEKDERQLDMFHEPRTLVHPSEIAAAREASARDNAEYAAERVAAHFIDSSVWRESVGLK